MAYISMGLRLPLSSKQTFIMIIYGAALWFLAANLLRIFAPMGVYDGMNRLALYALIIPGTVPFILLGKKLAALAKDQVGIAFALATGAATLLDGFALAWVPGLYGGTPEYVAGAGAAILWGAGVAIMLGLFFNRVEA